MRERLTSTDSGMPSEVAETKRPKKRFSPVWIVLLLMIVFLQWPMIKGIWYRATGTAAPSDHIAWRTDFAGALAESEKTGKPVLLDFSAAWCPPCQEMKHESWPDSRVGRIVTAGYIPVALDADAPTTRDPAARYSVDSIPRIIIINSHGNVLRDGSFMSADELAKFVKLPLNAD